MSRFAVPHDSTHVLAGYDTSPRGELLTSVFTAAMHRRNAMSGHVLPVILSWHLGIPLNEVAGAAKGALDPQEFWHAWARGEDACRSTCSIRPGISGPRAAAARCRAQGCRARQLILVLMFSSLTSRAYFAESARASLPSSSGVPPTGSIEPLVKLSCMAGVGQRLRSSRR